MKTQENSRLWKKKNGKPEDFKTWLTVIGGGGASGAAGAGAGAAINGAGAGAGTVLRCKRDVLKAWIFRIWSLIL